MKSIIVIGAGMAGLSTGCYAQMNGYQTQIFELHNQPGGLCTAWKRQGYTFDGCIRHLAGAGPGSRFYRIWEELGALRERTMLFPKELVRVEGPGGAALAVYSDLDRLEQHLHALSPADARPIAAYVGAARRLAGFDLFALLSGVAGPASALPFLPALLKWSRVTLEDYATRFSHPFLRRAFPLIQYGFSGVPALINLVFLAGCHTRSLGWPGGGSLEFSRSVARRYRELGGTIHYRSRVEQILVRGGRAAGVRLEDGSEHHADVVVSAADGRSTIFDMLGGRYVDEAIRGYYAAPPTVQPMGLQVSLGVRRDLALEPHAIVYILEQPVTIAGRPVGHLRPELFGFDLGMAPAGRSAIRVALDASYTHWKDLSADRQHYEAEKQQVAATLVDLLEPRFPGLRGQIEVIDVATPLTVERFTGNWRGLQAYPARTGTGIGLKGLSRTLPGLENFYMVGQWAGATTGVSTAAAAGRGLVQALCRRERRPFVAAVP